MHRGLVQGRRGNLSPLLAAIVPGTRAGTRDRAAALHLLVEDVEQRPRVRGLPLSQEQRARRGAAVHDDGRAVPELHLEHVSVFGGPLSVFLRVNLPPKPGQASD